MNTSDIEFLQERINRVLFQKISPEVILEAKEEVELRSLISKYESNPAIFLSLFNEFRGREGKVPYLDGDDIKYRKEYISSNHILASMINSKSIPFPLQDVAKEADPLFFREKAVLSLYFLLTEYEVDIVIEGKAAMPIHSFVKEEATSFTNLQEMRRVYSILRGSITLSGKICSFQAILGGMMKACIDEFNTTGREIALKTILKLDNGQVLKPKFINDSYDWYMSHIQVKVRTRNIDIIEQSCKSLLQLPTSFVDTSRKKEELDIFSPEPDLERIIIRCREPLDIIDTISAARTSFSVPMVIGVLQPRKIIKIYNKPDIFRSIDTSWFQGEKNGIILIVRISDSPVSFMPIQYNLQKNAFIFNRTERWISTSRIITHIVETLQLRTLYLPSVLSTSYSFITNSLYSATGEQIFFDRHLLAWLITNPPPKYRDINLGQYIFVKEDTKPNALRNHASIHIQLGAEKIYLTFSRHSVTAGTIATKNGKITGFLPNQEYTRVRINRAPTPVHARIAQTLYKHILSMYIEYFYSTKGTIASLTGIDLPCLFPYIKKLQLRAPSEKERFRSIDPLLFRYIDPSIEDRLPVPIEREEYEYLKSEGYGIIRLPTKVINNPYISFETSGELWLRTPVPGTFALHKKPKGGYIPVLRKGAKGEVLITINSDFTCIDMSQTRHKDKHILRKDYVLENLSGRFAHISDAAKQLLSSFISTKYLTSLCRVGLSLSLIESLNFLLMKSVSTKDLIPHAHLCKQECWDLSVENIVKDLQEGRISPDKHFRALEQAYSVNIFFFVDDMIAPYFNKPPHVLFYLHRRSNPQWKSIIFHSLSNRKDVFSLLARTSTPTPGSSGENYLFENSSLLDDQIDRNNILELVFPETGDRTIIQSNTKVSYNVSGWEAFEQIIDLYGKCRGLNYRKGSEVVTLRTNFLPVQNLPIGTIQPPSPSFEGNRSQLLIPSGVSSLNIWKRQEKQSRYLRGVTSLLYSLSKESVEDFFENVVVIPGIQYDTSKLPHALPMIGDSISAWKYFRHNIPGLISSRYQIRVPDKETREALYYYLKSSFKSPWPEKFPQYLQYSWDIKKSEDEMVFLSVADLLRIYILNSSPVETTVFVSNPNPYILKRNEKKYIVQMALSESHAKLIAYRWEEENRNIGYETVIYPVDYDWNEVEYDFLHNLDKISFTRYNGRIFVIIPIF